MSPLIKRDSKKPVCFQKNNTRFNSNQKLSNKTTFQEKEDYDDTLIKRLCNLGYGNRDEIADLIINCKVKINEEVITNLSFKPSYSDKITILGKQIENRRIYPKILLFHKPVKFLTTKSDPENRPIIYDILPQRYKNFITVGRLDFNTSGLLLLTNIGSIANELEDPNNKFSRIYKVKVSGNVNMEKLERLGIEGVRYQGKNYGKCIIKFIRKVNHETCFLKVIIFEGKNQEVRNIMKSQGLSVVKLERVAYGPYRLNDIPRGCVIEAQISHKSKYL